MKNQLNINHNNLHGGLWNEPYMNIPFIFNGINQTGSLFIRFSSHHYLQQPLKNYNFVFQEQTSLFLLAPVINFGQYQAHRSRIIGLYDDQYFVNRNRMDLFLSDFIQIRLLNSGLIVNHDQMELIHSTLINEGLIESRYLSLSNSFIENRNQFQLKNGTITQMDSSKFINYGSFSGVGIVGTKFQNRGEINPGNSDDNKLGQLVFEHHFSSEKSSIINIELGTSLFDQIKINGFASLSGTININLTDGFLPHPGQTFEILTYHQLDPSSQLNFQGLSLNEQLEFIPEFSENSLFLTVVEKFNSSSALTVNIDGTDTDLTGLLESYGGYQDKSESIVNYNINEVKLINNSWKTLNIGNYSITENTVLSFEFRSEEEGEVQGIGIDNDDSLTNNNNKQQMFKLHGTQNWGNQAFDNYQGLDDPQTVDGWKNYHIRLGQFVTAEFDRFVFINDNDTSNNLGGVSQFRNIALSEL